MGPSKDRYEPPQSPGPVSTRAPSNMSTRPPSTMDMSSSRPPTSLDMSTGSTVRPDSTLAVASKPGALALQDGGRDPDKWYEASDTQMCAAMKVFKFADRMFTNTARTHYKQARDGTRHYQRFSMLQQNFEDGNRKKHLKAQLKERLESLGHSIRATRRCLADLQSEKARQHDALEHCNWRLEQRNQRPPREQVQDGLEVALEQEQDALMHCQERLRHQGEECAKAKEKLEDLMESLTKDNKTIRKKPNPDEVEEPQEDAEPFSLANPVGQELLSFMDDNGFTLRQLWQTMDDNGNGRVTMDEFTDGIKMMNFVDEESGNRSTAACNSLFQAIDEDMTGSLSWKELQHFFDDLLDILRKTHPVGKALLEYLQENEWPLRQLWQYIDDGTDGRVDPDEFIRGMDKAGFLNNDLENHTVGGCTQFFHAIDQDRTGVISWHEFQSFFAELIKMVEEQNKGRDFLRELARTLAIANAVERESKWMREESQDAIRSASIYGGMARRRVQAEMKKKIQTTQGLKKRLEFLISEAESRIRLHRWRSTWKDHAEVVKVAEKKWAGKKYFTDREDPIGAAEDLENQKDCEPLEVLDEAIQALKADLADKSAALALDERCKYSRVVDGNIIVELPPTQPRSPKTGHFGLALPAPNPARPVVRARSSPVSDTGSKSAAGIYGASGRQSSKNSARQSKGSGFGASVREDPSLQGTNNTAGTPGPGLYSPEQSKPTWAVPSRTH
eukprot:gnl/MRDRNA2_/MRDRNA2_97083_c0_seq1.p1 gnl/MRDRNA2_/MRDRNA2_97083_c0~~gnl/MRDRNA2_/MRDRNA2_97083_c0_seq1.p1  ORF type:complete len:731 (-),score=164.90 gnl/MRDRNA2_/MRDRNA2_97083_c0_seq1:77-2269(-)